MAIWGIMEVLADLLPPSVSNYSSVIIVCEHMKHMKKNSCRFGEFKSISHWDLASLN